MRDAFQQRITDLFEAALREAPGRRSEFLRSACAGDEALLSEVTSLVAEYELAGDQTNAEPAPRASASQLAALFPELVERGPLAAEGAGSVIGSYRLLSELGSGGMGVVYEAEQLHSIRRRVALKIVKPGMDSKEVISRFEGERQALAMMGHPNIAQVFDAGTTAAGRPYFVMELVDGAQITRYCDAGRLSVRERLELFIPVCQAIQHAHQKGIIHRDIKPSNLIVTRQDGRPVPKVIDFGIAKAVGQNLTEATIATHVGTVIGTLDYMSPEQADLVAHDVDTRSDIYSLGAVLYELLTGRTPHEIFQSETGYIRSLQRIREEDPPPPSARLSRSPETLREISTLRRTDAGRLPKLLRGELDWIVMKSLEKDRTRRYETVDALARDLRRYLDGEPVEAGPPSAAYRARKFAGKYRLWLATGTAFAALLLAASIVSTWTAVRAARAEQSARKERDRAARAEQTAVGDRNRALAAEAQARQDRNQAIAEKQRADTEAATAGAVSGFLRDDLLAQASAYRQSRPDRKPDPDIKVRTLLDWAAAAMKGRFDSQPLVEASVRDTIGNTYTDLGVYAEAARQLERALDLRRRALGTEHADTLTSMDHLAMVYQFQGKFAPAEALERDVLRSRKRILGPAHPDTLTATNNLAEMYRRQDKFPPAEALDTEVWEARKRMLGSAHPDTLIAAANLALVYMDQGKYPQAEALDAQVLPAARRVWGAEHPQTLSVMNNLAEILRHEGKHAPAETLDKELLEIRKRVLGPEHPVTLITMNNLALVYKLQGKFSQAEALHAQVWEVNKRVRGPEHPETLSAGGSLAAIYERQGKYAEAEALHTQLLELNQRVLGPEHTSTLINMANLAVVYRNQGKFAQAEALDTRALEAGRRVWGPEHPNTLSIAGNLAGVYDDQGKYPEAEALFTQVLEIRKRVSGPEHPGSLIGTANLAAFYRKQGKYAQAEALGKQVLEAGRRVWGAEHPNTLTIMSNLAGIYDDQAKYREAESLLTQSLEIKKRVSGRENSGTLLNMVNLAVVYRRQGKYKPAEALFTEALEIRRRVLGPAHADTLSTINSLASLYQLQSEHVRAEQLLREGLPLFENKMPDHWERFRCQSLLGASLSAQRKYADAEPLLVGGYEGLLQRKSKIPQSARTSLNDAGESIAQLYQAWGKPERAAEWREKIKANLVSAREIPHD